MHGGVVVEHDRTWTIPIRFDSTVDHARPSSATAIEAPIGALDGEAEEVLKALAEVSAASIALARLGIPRGSGVVAVRPNGPLPAASLPALERILHLFMWSRGRRAGHPPRDVSVSILPAGDARPIRSDALDPRSAAVGFSGGMDSTACLKHLLESGYLVRAVFYRYYTSPSGGLKGELAHEQKAVAAVGEHLGRTVHRTWTHRARVANITPLSSTPFETLIDDVDNDPWPFYGRNLLTAALLLWEAVAAKAKWAALGATAEDMFASVSVGGEEFYSDCCQSAPFFSLFNLALDGLFEGARPGLAAPLLAMHKGSVAGYLARDPGLMARTRSCINDGQTEDGTCFSCFDKLTGILSAFPSEELDLRVDDGTLVVLNSGMEVARFRWLAAKAEGDSNERYSFPEVCATQLSRLLSGPQSGDGRLWHSKFNPAAVLGMMHNLRRRPDLLSRLFPDRKSRELAARGYAAVDADSMASLARPWAEPNAPLDLSRAASELQGLVDWRLVPQSRRAAGGPRHYWPSPRS